MEENLHRQTFEDILNLNTKGSVERQKLSRTPYWFIFPQQLGKIFHYAHMCSRKLPFEAHQRQKYAEKIAKKYNCKVSYHIIYANADNIENLQKVRSKLIESMYVSPVFWAPIGAFDEHCPYWNLKTFAFGFLPYCEKKPFIYDEKMKVIYHYSDSNCYPIVNNQWFSDEYRDVEDTDQLHQLISMRINLLKDGMNPDTITLSKDKTKLQYKLTHGDYRYVKLSDDSKYPEDMTAQEYFNAVIRDNDAEYFVMHEYKMLFMRRPETYHWNEDDSKKEPAIRFFNIWKLLANRISVSSCVDLLYDGHLCYWFHYDDKRLDKISQHLGFFDTRELQYEDF